jgi:hypothetical protein
MDPPPPKEGESIHEDFMILFRHTGLGDMAAEVGLIQGGSIPALAQPPGTPHRPVADPNTPVTGVDALVAHLNSPGAGQPQNGGFGLHGTQAAAPYSPSQAGGVCGCSLFLLAFMFRGVFACCFLPSLSLFAKTQKKKKKIKSNQIKSNHIESYRIKS